jgi:salicylate hydroxylase
LIACFQAANHAKLRQGDCLGVLHFGAFCVLGAKMTIKGQSVTILGAGIAGLTLARALARHGADVTVLEQAAAITQVGAGIQIAPNGAAVLRALDLGGALAAHSMQADAVQLLDGRSGRPVMQMDLTRRPQDRHYHFLHRADLIAMLMRGLDAQIVLGAQVADVDLGGDAPVLHMADGTQRAAGILIGADGIHSRTRAALNTDAPPFFTGQIAWRCIIAGDGAAAPSHAQVFMGPGRHLVSYPLRGGRLRNIVAVQERSEWTSDSWSNTADPAELRRAFAGFCPTVQGWLARAEQVSEWGLHRRPVAASWGRILPQGAAFILGDAAHPTLPFLAQGASMGIEDAWVLAQTLVQQNGATALAQYQSLRAPRTARITAAATGNARNYHLSGVPRLIGHTALRALGAVAPDLMLRRFDWLYGMDVTQS